MRDSRPSARPKRRKRQGAPRLIQNCESSGMPVKPLRVVGHRRQSPTSCEVGLAAMISWSVALPRQWGYAAITRVRGYSGGVNPRGVVCPSECLGPILFLHRAAIDNIFISENGFVAAFGDEAHAVGPCQILIAPLIDLVSGAVPRAELVCRWPFDAQPSAARLGVQSPAMAA